MAVIYWCDRCNTKSENTHYCEYEGYRCGDITTFGYRDKEGKFHELELCFDYSDEENSCLGLFKKEKNIQWLDIRIPGQGFRGWKEITDGG